MSPASSESSSLNSSLRVVKASLSSATESHYHAAPDRTPSAFVDLLYRWHRSGVGAPWASTTADIMELADARLVVARHRPLLEQPCH
ncbi:hypothetical protein [Oryza sativa Japonica Group]|uniref:Uncharacterized protein n=1 Tax=Oryza sativa subsp. japonica TaxID=39947 RepID=Q5ZEA7_ORYSJ|nr:hypothetical protein [Oryza sativa Japonica Group]